MTDDDIRSCYSFASGRSITTGEPFLIRVRPPRLLNYVRKWVRCPSRVSALALMHKTSFCFLSLIFFSSPFFGRIRSPVLSSSWRCFDDPVIIFRIPTVNLIFLYNTTQLVHDLRHSVAVLQSFWTRTVLKCWCFNSHDLRNLIIPKQKVFFIWTTYL